jgi:cell division protein FtsQ
VRLADGPALYFGDSARLAAKWAAVVRILQDRSSAGATYLDVRIPERSAAGGIAPIHPQTDAATGGPAVGAQPAQPTPATPQTTTPATPATPTP